MCLGRGWNHCWSETLPLTSGSYSLWRLPLTKVREFRTRAFCAKSQSVTLSLPTSKATAVCDSRGHPDTQPLPPQRQQPRRAGSRVCLLSVPRSPGARDSVFVTSRALGKTDLIADCFPRISSADLCALSPSEAPDTRGQCSPAL